MNKLARWIDGIRMPCTQCGTDQQGVLMIGNNAETGCTEELWVECNKCHHKMMKWEKYHANNGPQGRLCD